MRLELIGDVLDWLDIGTRVKTLCTSLKMNYEIKRVLAPVKRADATFVAKFTAKLDERSELMYTPAYKYAYADMIAEVNNRELFTFCEHRNMPMGIAMHVNVTRGNTAKARNLRECISDFGSQTCHNITELIQIVVDANRNTLPSAATVLTTLIARRICA